jgi:hypothetical protein
MSVQRSLFGPVALIGAGVLLLLHNLVGGYSFWTAILDHWPWFLVAWGTFHVTQHALAHANDAPGPPRLGAGALALGLLICLAGGAGRAIRDNDGVVFRGFGVRVQVRDPAFHQSYPPPDARRPSGNESP